jgi:hypothetical protein
MRNSQKTKGNSVCYIYFVAIQAVYAARKESQNYGQRMIAWRSCVFIQTHISYSLGHMSINFFTERTEEILKV